MVKIARDGVELQVVDSLQQVYQALARGELRLTDLYWQASMEDWDVVGNLPGASDAAPQAPPIPQPDRYGRCSRLTYIILALLAGALGVHNLYANRTGVGLVQLVATVVLCWTIIVPLTIAAWALIEAFAVTRDGTGAIMP